VTLLTKLPDIGKITLVLAVAVRVVLNAPEVTKLPPNVIVLAPLFVPVPPLDAAKGLPRDTVPGKNVFWAKKFVPSDQIVAMVPVGITTVDPPVDVVPLFAVALLIVKFPESVL
jgi:hypothetical protein